MTERKRQSGVIVWAREGVTQSIVSLDLTSCCSAIVLECFIGFGGNMIRFYQTEWFGIPFDSFASLSFFSLADGTFYEKFYDAFFEKFTGYDALPEQWQAINENTPRLLLHIYRPLLRRKFFLWAVALDL